MASGRDIIRLTLENELESIHIESFINNSGGKVSKVSDQSTLRGLIRGNVKTGKKALKDIALAVSHLMPDLAFDTTLDTVAGFLGISPRFAAAQSSTWVRLRGDEGTFYQAGTNTVSDSRGNIFDLQFDVTIGEKGYDYVKVRSQQSGSVTNVNSQTIVNINPEPVGHIGVLNEYKAIGGRDIEDDDTFRQRIKEGPDILAQNTLSYLTQAFIKVNTNVLRTVFDGVSQTGKNVLSILTVNGIDLTSDELETLLEQTGQFFALSDLNPMGTQSYGVELKNATYSNVDVDFRIDLFSGADIGTVVADIQQKFSKLMDFRFFDASLDTIQIDNLLSAIKNTSGVKSCPDKYFTPSTDIQLQNNEFPMFRGFIVRDLMGTILLSQIQTDPLFYSNSIVENLQETVL